MKNRPKELTFLALFLFAVAIGIPAQIMVLYEHPITEFAAILAKITPINWMVLFLAPVVGVLVWRANPVAKYLVPVFGMLVVYNNWFVSEVGADYSAQYVKFATGVFLLCLGTIMTRDVREILTHPERRWWLTPRRKEAELPIRVCFFQKRGKDAIRSQEFYAKTHDISLGGVYVNLDEDDMALMSEDTLSSMKLGTQCFLCITLKDLCFLQCRAEIVRHNGGTTGKYPSGIGLKFLGLNWNDAKTLKEFLVKEQVRAYKPQRHKQAA